MHIVFTSFNRRGPHPDSFKSEKAVTKYLEKKKYKRVGDAWEQKWELGGISTTTKAEVVNEISEADKNPVFPVLPHTL